MEVKESEWKKLATKNITQYVHRGGENQGDVPQLLGGTDLLNTIGMAMGLPTCNPENWTKDELEMALKGKLVYYENEALEAIDIVAEQIKYCCSGDSRNFVTVLPIELYHEEKLYELPVFRVKRTAKSENYYVDNVGRSYSSVSDWRNNNKLPPGQMAYPRCLRLELAGSTKEAFVSIADTPSAGLDAMAARGLDKVAAVAGLTSSVALMFLTGGLATPLVVTALGAASYGTGRASYQLVEKATHGESINPFTNTQSRMLWLGIAANLTSFGAMGATMRLTSLAARGREVSTALRVFADVVNGTNIAVSGVAILNTTIFMIINHKDMTAVDVLMHGASIAFWTKGLYCYKTASMIIKDAENYAFATLNKGMNAEEASQFAALRNRVQNDPKLLQKIHAAMEANISVKDYSKLLIDGMQYYETISNLSPDQIDAFDNLRNYMGDDLRLISGLRRVADRYNLNRPDTIDLVLNMWQQMSAANSNEGANIILKGGNLILGRAPPIKIELLPQLSAPMIKFFGEHLSRADAVTSAQWSTSVPVLLSLQSKGMFNICSVTRVVQAGRSVVDLNGHLQISIYRLHSMSTEECNKVFTMVGGLRSGISSSALPLDLVRLCVIQQRLRLECHRTEAIAFATRCCQEHPTLMELVRSDLRNNEKDRLYTFMHAVKLGKADLYMSKMMTFVSEMIPTNVSEMVAYCEFAITCVGDEMVALRLKINSGELQVPAQTNVTDWTRNRAHDTVFRNTAGMRHRFAELCELAQDNDMVGAVTLSPGLTDSQLVAALRDVRVRFGSVTSAAYHAGKRPTTPPAAFVTRANETLRGADSWTVTLGQDGDVRFITFEDGNGKTHVLERDGSIVLCSFIEKHR